MLFSASPGLEKRKEAELLVVPVWDTQKKARLAANEKELEPICRLPLEAKDFKGNEGEVCFLYNEKLKEKRCLLLGLGKEELLSVESLRRAYSNVAKECQKKALTKINILLPNIVELRKISVEGCLKGISEGILLTNYRFEKLFSIKEETVLLESVHLIGILPKNLEIIQSILAICEGVYFTRDLVNGNADIITPSYLAESANQIAEKFTNVKATLFNREDIEKEGLGLLAAVSRSSYPEPYFIILEYKGYSSSKDHTVIVGKGITFDTGGLNLKPTGSMETMRDDMAGGAVALSCVAVAASLGLKLNVTAVVPSTENAIDARSFKPGDVYQSYSGRTVEIGNTDAEGRLILADALSYSIKNLKPSRLIDLATLTGSIVVGLGEGMAGLFCNNDTLAAALLKASDRTGEILWRMPLFAPYKEDLKSDIADIKNIGGRSGGPIKAALFLQEFVKDIPWAHLDIAGPAFATKEKGYNPKNAVGFGVRLIMDYLQNLSAAK